MKNILLTVLLLAVSLHFTMCTKDSGSGMSLSEPRPSLKSQVSELLQLQTLLDNKVGDVGVINFKTASGDPTSLTGHESFEIRGAFYDQAGGTKIPQGDLSVGGSILTGNSYHRYTKFMGPIATYYDSDVAITLEDSLGNQILDDSLSLAKSLYLTSPTILSNTDTIPKATTLVWNADPNNPREFYILLEFWPLDTGNEAFASTHDGHYRFINTSDDGSHTLSNSDFGPIPNNARVFIHMARGNYKESTLTGGKPVMLYSYSLISLEVTVQD